jgi:hypothetical protein
MHSAPCAGGALSWQAAAAAARHNLFFSILEFIRPFFNFFFKDAADVPTAGGFGMRPSLAVTALGLLAFFAYVLAQLLLNKRAAAQLRAGRSATACAAARVLDRLLFGHG